MDYIASLYKTRCQKLAEEIEIIKNKINILEAEKREYDAAGSPLLVSTRVPTSKKLTYDPHNLIGSDRLVVGMDAMEPEHVERLATTLRQYPISGPNPSSDPSKLIADVKGRVQRNIEYGLDRAESLPELAARSAQWYVGANKISNRFGKRFGHPEHVAAGVLAALSPQKDWYQNTSLGERVMKIHKEHSNAGWSPEMDAAAKRFFDETNPKHAAGYAAIKGKTLSQIQDPIHAAMWIRAYDEGHHPRHFRTVTPEGDFGEHMLTGKNERATAAWGSFKEIGNAVKIIRSQGNMNVISRALGNQHKVRSFYNNILQPNNPDRPDVTIDTHAIGSGLANPELAGSSEEVSLGLGGSPRSAMTGIGGSYPLLKDVVTKVGQERNIIPSAVQSITWDEKRAAVPAKGKGVKARKKAVGDAWRAFKAGALSDKDVLDIYGSTFPEGQLPTWANTKTQGAVSTFESVSHKIKKLVKYLKG